MYTIAAQTETAILITSDNFDRDGFHLTPAMEARITERAEALRAAGVDHFALPSTPFFMWSLCGMLAYLGETEIVLEGIEDDFGNDNGHLGWVNVNEDGSIHSYGLMTENGEEATPYEGEEGYFLNRIEEIEEAIEDFLDEHDLIFPAD